jgi:uncharacterized protein YjiK
MALSAFVMGCSSPEQTTTQQASSISDTYYWDQPSTLDLPDPLFEISGITFHQNNPEIIFAIQDEDGEVFKINWQDGLTSQTLFEKQGDYEDISILNDHVYILRSDGTIFRFPYSDLDYKQTQQTQSIQLLPRGEYEGMFGDSKTGLIYVLCKECKKDQDLNHVSGYILSTNEGLQLKDTFSLHVAQIRDKAAKLKKGFRPSALAKNPITEEWYILSSTNKLLVVADANWKIINTTALDKEVHIQPEGIAFDAEGHLYISNEGKNKRAANIMQFKRK